MSSLDMSVEDHDHYNPDEDGIPIKCWCGCQPVCEMFKKNTDNYGRMAYMCTHKDADKGGHLFRWFDRAVYYEFYKIRFEIQQVRRLTEVQESITERVGEFENGIPNPRMALLEEAHDILKEEVRVLKDELVRERKRVAMMLVCLGVSLNHDNRRQDAHP